MLRPLDRLVSGMGYASYKDYLKSEHWLEFCGWVKKKECYCCCSRKRLQLHHITYENIGNESPADVVTLCNECHEAVHELVGAGTKLLIAHIEHRKVMRFTRTEIRKIKDKKPTTTRWLKRSTLLEECDKFSVPQIIEFMSWSGLVEEDKATEMAYERKLVRIYQGEEYWHLTRFICYMKRRGKKKFKPHKKKWKA